MSCEDRIDPALEAALARYDEAWDDWMRRVADQGVRFEEFGASRPRCQALRSQLAERGAVLRNGGASVVAGALSPACVACTGTGLSCTFFISLACHRRCYYCFNINQIDYGRYCREDYPWRGDLDRLAQAGAKPSCLGLTGGEPLLCLDETLAFFSYAHEMLPEAHLRLYTSGDLLDAAMLDRLAASGLTEIRFSLKLEDMPQQREKVFANMALARDRIPAVMVEMPAIPGTESEMRDILNRLDALGIFGINLLEFCYPMHEWKQFERRGFSLANPPFSVLYDYDYAGGLPVSGSEELCLKLVAYALDEGLSLNVHYCSLENKHRMEMIQRNANPAFRHPCYVLDPDDFFLKTCKVYGTEVDPVQAALKAAGWRDFIEDAEESSLAFPPSALAVAQSEGAHPVFSYNVLEECDTDLILREVELEPAWE